MLLPNDDDMVQKGLGWLLREAAKANPEQTVAYLMTIRDRTPRLVLRTACETIDSQLAPGSLARAPAPRKRCKDDRLWFALQLALLSSTSCLRCMTP